MISKFNTYLESLRGGFEYELDSILPEIQYDVAGERMLVRVAELDRVDAFELPL